jgi:hypothetical protein
MVSVLYRRADAASRRLDAANGPEGSISDVCGHCGTGSMEMPRETIARHQYRRYESITKTSEVASSL